MPLPIALALTACFAVCGGYAATRMRHAGAERRRYVSRLGMAAAMVFMVWSALPVRVAVVSAGAAAVAAIWLVARARPGRRLADLHHAGMVAVMALMFAAMAQERPPESSSGHHHGGSGGHHGETASMLSPLDSLLLVAALVLLLAAALWWGAATRDRSERRGAEGCRRDGGLEWLASLGMATAAAAMAVTH